MTKILITTSTFNDILGKHPEVELDLVRQAVPEIAARVPKKAEEQAPKLSTAYEQMLDRTMRNLNDRYHMAPAAKAVIREFLREEGVSLAKELITAGAREEVDKACQARIDEHFANVRRRIAEHLGEAERKLNALAKQAAEDAFLQLLKAGNLTVKEA